MSNVRMAVSKFETKNGAAKKRLRKREKMRALFIIDKRSRMIID